MAGKRLEGSAEFSTENIYIYYLEREVGMLGRACRGADSVSTPCALFLRVLRVLRVIFGPRCVDAWMVV